MHSIKIYRSKIAPGTLWLSLPKFHYACKRASAFSCGLWDISTEWVCQFLVKNKMSLDLPHATSLCMLTLECQIWNISNAKFSQVVCSTIEDTDMHSHSPEPKNLLRAFPHCSATGFPMVVWSHRASFAQSTKSQLQHSLGGAQPLLVTLLPLVEEYGTFSCGLWAIILNLLEVMTETTQGAWGTTHSVKCLLSKHENLSFRSPVPT